MIGAQREEIDFQRYKETLPPMERVYMERFEQLHASVKDVIQGSRNVEAGTTDYTDMKNQFKVHATSMTIHMQTAKFPKSQAIFTKQLKLDFEAFVAKVIKVPSRCPSLVQELCRNYFGILGGQKYLEKAEPTINLKTIDSHIRQMAYQGVQNEMYSAAHGVRYQDHYHDYHKKY